MRTITRTTTAAIASTAAVAIAIVHAQVGRGGSEWLTARADAQRTSWIRTDAKISVESMSKPGFELQWSSKLDNAARHGHGLTQGVSANGVTLFVPMSILGGSSNNIYALDNDIGYVVWQRRFEAALADGTPQCPGGITAAATRIVPLVPPPIVAPPAAGRAGQSYRSVIGEPGAGVPLETRGGRGPAPAPPAPSAARGTPPSTPPAPPPQRGRANLAPLIPGAPPLVASGNGRPSGVVYAISSDGMLRVLGLQSGKDLQRPAPFLPAGARWSDAIAVGTTLYAATTGRCGGTPNGVWAIDLDTEAKPVVSWNAGDDEIVGPIAFTTTGALVVVKHNGIVALDAKSLTPTGSFAGAAAQFVTGPTVFRHNDKEIIAAATKDNRFLLFDAASLGSAPLLVSRPFSTTGDFAADGLATWQEMTITPPPPPPPGTTPAFGAQANTPANVTLGMRWILAPVSGGIVAMKLTDSGGTLALEPGWSARNISAPATPIVVNGVVFALATGRSYYGDGADRPAVLRAYEAKTGKLLWDSKSVMKSAAAPGSFWSAMGQVYVGTNDGTVYAFGFLDERR